MPPPTHFSVVPLQVAQDVPVPGPGDIPGPVEDRVSICGERLSKGRWSKQ